MTPASSSVHSPTGKLQPLPSPIASCVLFAAVISAVLPSCCADRKYAHPSPSTRLKGMTACLTHHFISLPPSVRLYCEGQMRHCLTGSKLGMLEYVRIPAHHRADALSLLFRR